MTHSSSHHHHHHHHALCCLSSAPPQPEASPTPAPEPAAVTATPGPGSVAVAGVLHKWTNYGRGWRERWFSLRDGVLSYSKIRADAGGGEAAGRIADDGEVRLIGGASARIAGGRRPEKPVGVVCLKVGGCLLSSPRRLVASVCTRLVVGLGADSVSISSPDFASAFLIDRFNPVSYSVRFLLLLNFLALIPRSSASFGTLYCVPGSNAQIPRGY